MLGASLEIHQIRYFLALSRSLNFTRAAEECHVSQPALTRAVQALEAELGGALMVRERRTSHLTDLGKRMLPLLQRCYDSAMSAKELARAAANPAAAPLRIALSHTVNVERLMAPIAAMFRSFPLAHLTLIHGGGCELLAALKAGDADLAVAGPLARDWDRLDDWPLWEEGFVAALASGDPLTDEAVLQPAQLAERARVTQGSCESRAEIAAWLESQGVEQRLHEVVTQAHVAAFVEKGLGIALQPASGVVTAAMRTIPVAGLDVRRMVSAYAVAGRARSAPANALLALLRAGAAEGRAAA